MLLTETRCFTGQKIKFGAPEETRSDQQKQQALWKRSYCSLSSKLRSTKELFINDIVMYQDGGGKMAAALKPMPALIKSLNSSMSILDLDPEVEVVSGHLY